MDQLKRMWKTWLPQPGGQVKEQLLLCHAAERWYVSDMHPEDSLAITTLSTSSKEGNKDIISKG